MNIWSLLALAVGLSADAFAAAFVSGTGDRTNHIRSGILTSALFGIFQALMPVLGWSIGKAGSLMASWAEYTAASIILCFLGIKLIFDSRSQPEPEGTGMRPLFALAFATSIDALTAGIALPAAAGAENFSGLCISVAVIGSVTFILCLTGFFLGKGLSGLRPSVMQMIGGLVLIIIGIKTFFSGAV